MPAHLEDRLLLGFDGIARQLGRDIVLPMARVDFLKSS
jgi:hypothetical protein